MYKLYWIKYSTFTNPHEEGYIGVTSQTILKRFNEHKHNTKNQLLKNRCRKENVTITCLHDDLSKEEAEKLEEQYRPIENIGWNMNKGGNLPPSRKGKPSPKSLLIGENRTDAQKIGSRKQAEKMRGRIFGPSKLRKDKRKTCLWCEETFEYRNNNKKQKYCCMAHAAAHRNSKPEVIALYAKKTKQSWINGRQYKNESH